VAEVREAVDFLRFYANDAERVMAPHTLPGPTGESNTLRLEGRGAWVCISPWNCPLAIFVGQEAAALVTGNTVIDALLLRAASAPLPQIPGLDWERQRVILATVHRRENWGERLTSIADGFRQLLDRHPDTALLLPLHRNPTVREPLQQLLGQHPRAHLCEPLDYDQLVGAIRGCTLLLSDSGGLQEEAPALGKPVLVLRRTTERPEAVTAGTARLIGTDSTSIVEEASRLLDDPQAYAAMAQAHNPFGDGQASGRILEASRSFLSRAAVG
jgi:UDP-N-acetylglucosamine 2-epimerase (non-hydrolysing)